jgi:hypothetical protein
MKGGVTPSLAEGAAGIEPTGNAKRGTATKSEALASQAKGKTKHKVDVPLQGKKDDGKHCNRVRCCEGARECSRHCHKRVSKTPKCKCGMMLKSSPNKGEDEPSWPPQRHRTRTLGGSNPFGLQREVSEGGGVRIEKV